MGYKAYSDSYLMSLTKPQIIELLRVAEHNFLATEEALNNSAKAGMEIAEKFDKAKELLKIAVKTMNDGSCDKDCSLCDHCKPCDFNCRFEWKYTKEALELLNDEKINNVE